MSALEQEGTTLTFKLRDDYDSVWITVDGISVYVRRTEHGARVELYPRGNEDVDPPLDHAVAESDPEATITSAGDNDE